MDIQELKPHSANWNQIKAEYARNNTVFEALKSEISDKKTIEALNSIIKANDSAIQTMTKLEKTPMKFENKPIPKGQ